MDQRDRNKKIRLRQVTTEPDFTQGMSGNASVTEEQPQQDDHRNRYAHQPKQKSFSHRLLLEIPDCDNNAEGRERFLLWFRYLRQRKSDSKQRIAMSIDGFAHFGVDASAWRLRVSRHSSSEVPEGNGASAFVTSRKVGWRTCTKNLYKVYQWPVFGIDVHGSAGGFGSPFCNSSIECRSGERTNAMLPSRGGRLMVMPAFISRSQVA